jgi:hypothetical protein
MRIRIIKAKRLLEGDEDPRRGMKERMEKAEEAIEMFFDQIFAQAQSVEEHDALVGLFFDRMAIYSSPPEDGLSDEEFVDLLFKNTRKMKEPAEMDEPEPMRPQGAQDRREED